MLERFIGIAVTLGLTVTVAPCLAGDTSDKWKDQDSWERFSDKEQTRTFKVERSHIAPKSDSVLAPALKPNKPSASDSGSSYVIMPAAEHQEAPPQVKTETTLVPVVRQDAPFASGYWGGGYWGGGFYGGPHGYWGAPGWGSPFGYGFGSGARSTVMMRPVTKVTQTGPSKPSGNYYAPATPDPTASGSYFASPSGLPKAAPIIHQDGKPDDYWGNSGNPLPKDMQP